MNTRFPSLHDVDFDLQALVALDAKLAIDKLWISFAKKFRKTRSS